jgi:hypothetical protein
VTSAGGVIITEMPELKKGLIVISKIAKSDGCGIMLLASYPPYRLAAH